MSFYVTLKSREFAVCKIQVHTFTKTLLKCRTYLCHTYIFHSFSENLVKLLAVSHKNPITIRDKLRPQIRLVPTKFFDPPTSLLSIFISLLSLCMSNLFYFFFKNLVKFPYVKLISLILQKNP